MTSFLRPTPVYLAVALSIVLTAAVARADLGDCGQPRTSGQKATATDCLFLLQFAVGAQEFDRPCICDLDRSGVTTATDALMCLRIAVGNPLQTNCYCPYAQINITLAGTGTAPMLDSETAGAPGVNDDHWNNLTGTETAGLLSALNDGDGTAVPNFAVSYLRVGQGTLNDGAGTDDNHMFGGNIDAYAYPAYEMVIVGAPYPRYDVYAYHQGGAPAGLRRVAQGIVKLSLAAQANPSHGRVSRRYYLVPLDESVLSK
jgi:hypothetical protein